MRCFYCAEEIQDAAVVCRYCGRDLQFMKPFVERIVELERRQAELENAMEELAARGAATPASGGDDTPRPSGGERRKVVIAAAGAVLGSWLAYVIGRQFGYSPTVLIISICVPLPFGLWAGLWTRGRGHGRWYALFGALSGLIAYAVVQATWRAVAPQPVPWTAEDLRYFFFYVLGACLLFLTGGLVGDRIKDLLHPPPRRVVVRSKTTSGGGGDAMQKLADMVTSMAPLITFLGSIIAAYQTFQAAMPSK